MCNCVQILFKLSPEGWGSELKRRSLGANEELSFAGWNEEMVSALNFRRQLVSSHLTMQCDSSLSCACSQGAITARLCQALASCRRTNLSTRIERHVR